MNLDDEAILSAYLDDELDPAVRVEISALLEADPALAERLVGLTAVHNAVAGLSRPVPAVSLAGLVMARIESAESVRARRPLYWLATAASVAFAFALTLRSGLLGPAKVQVQQAVVATDVVPIPPTLAGPEPLNVARTASPAPPITLPKPLGPVADPAEDGRRLVFDMLDRPGLSRILIVTDIIDPAARDRVHSLLRESSRKEVDFGRITIAQGIVIDPDYPNGADVFPVVMDEPEREQFLSKVAHEFDPATHPATIEYTELISEPRLATRLAQIGNITVGKGQPAAGLIPHSDSVLALKPVGSQDLTIRPGGGDPEAPVRNAPGNEIRTTTVPNVASKNANPTTPSKSRAVPVLVWVTSKQPSRLVD
jgi:hypothetical protein